MANQLSPQHPVAQQPSATPILDNYLASMNLKSSKVKMIDVINHLSALSSMYEAQLSQVSTHYQQEISQLQQQYNEVYAMWEQAKAQLQQGWGGGMSGNAEVLLQEQLRTLQNIEYLMSARASHVMPYGN